MLRREHTIARAQESFNVSYVRCDLNELAYGACQKKRMTPALLRNERRRTLLRSLAIRLLSSHGHLSYLFIFSRCSRALRERYVRDFRLMTCSRSRASCINYIGITVAKADRASDQPVRTHRLHQITCYTHFRKGPSASCNLQPTSASKTFIMS